MKKFMVLLSVALLSFAFVACGDDDESNLDSGVDFTNYASSTLKIKNTTTSVDLVIFKGPPAAINVIGGVRGGQTSGISQAKVPFKEMYVINAVTLTDYKNNINNPTACKITASQMVYVDTDAITVDMAGDNSGDAKVFIGNNTKYHVEVRTSSFMGPTLLVARPYEDGTKYVVSGEYTLYPTIIAAIKDANNVITGTKRAENPLQIKRYDVSASEPVMFNFTSDGIAAFKASAAVIKVKNELTDKGGAYLMVGSTPQVNTLGRTTINEGATRVYEIKGDLGSDDKYSDISSFGYNLPGPNGGTTLISTLNGVTKFTNGSEYSIVFRLNGASTITYTGTVPVD